jgi:hypothetical protein
MAQTIRAAVLFRVERHLARAGISATRFGYLVSGDPGLVRKLRDGRDFKVATLEKVEDYLRRHKKR